MKFESQSIYSSTIYLSKKIFFEIFYDLFGFDCENYQNK
jgi:hypothetical protein